MFDIYESNVCVDMKYEWKYGDARKKDDMTMNFCVYVEN